MTMRCVPGEPESDQARLRPACLAAWCIVAGGTAWGARSGERFGSWVPLSNRRSSR